jgi:hypothetical protein
MSRETIGSFVLIARYVQKHEVQHCDGCHPAINCCVGLQIWIFEHSLDAGGVDFNNKVLDTDDVYAQIVKGTEEAVEFNLGL